MTGVQTCALPIFKAGEIILVGVEGEGESATFTFKGEPKGGTPDSPEALEPEVI